MSVILEALISPPGHANKVSEVNALICQLNEIMFHCSQNCFKDTINLKATNNVEGLTDSKEINA